MKKNYYTELSNFFSTTRKNRRYTMAVVSKETGMSTGYLSDIENRLEERVGIPRKTNLEKLVKFYRLNEEEEKIYLNILLNLIINNFFTEEQAKKVKNKHCIED